MVGKASDGDYNPGLEMGWVNFEPDAHCLWAPAPTSSAQPIDDSLLGNLCLQASESSSRCKISLEGFELNFRENSLLCFPGDSV